MTVIMKGITCCADCAYYSMKKHRCTRATDEGKPTDRFYADCPLPTVTKPQGWISVKDRLPEIRHAVLGYTPFHENIWAITLHEDGCWYFWHPGTSKYDPDWYGPITHWMPMPEKPKEEENAD